MSKQPASALEQQAAVETLRRAPLGVALVESHGRVLLANDALCALVGRASRDVVAEPFIDLVDARDRVAVEALLDELARGRRESFDVEARFTRPGGAAVHARLVASRSTAASQGDATSVLLVHDVTESRRALDALRDSEALFRAAFENAPSGVAIVDREGRIERANPALAALLRASPAALHGASWRDFVHPDDLPRVLALRERLWARELPSFHVEARFVATDGAVAWADVGVSLVAEWRDRRPRAVVQVRDLTRRKSIEEALAGVARDRQRIVDAIRDVFLRLDADGRVTEWNRAALEAFRIEESALRGKPFTDLVVAETRADAMNAVLAAFLAGRAELEASLETDLAVEPRVVEWTLARLDAPTDSGLAVFGRDVTTRREAEATLRQQSVTKDLVRHMMIALGARSSANHLRMRDVGRDLARRVGEMSLEPHLEAFTAMGLGTLKLASAHRDRYTFEGVDMLEVSPGSGQSTCLLPLGFLEGAVGAMHGAALGSETRCRSLGHASCTFVVQARGNWRGGAPAPVATRAPEPVADQP